MLNALNSEKSSDYHEGWTLVDCLRSSAGDGKFNPPTYGAVDIDKDGIEHPCDPMLHPDVEAMSKQALDYIFWLRSNGRDASNHFAI